MKHKAFRRPIGKARRQWQCLKRFRNIWLKILKSKPGIFHCKAFYFTPSHVLNALRWVSRSTIFSWDTPIAMVPTILYVLTLQAALAQVRANVWNVDSWKFQNILFLFGLRDLEQTWIPIFCLGRHWTRSGEWYGSDSHQFFWHVSLPGARAHSRQLLDLPAQSSDDRKKIDHFCDEL